MQLHCHQCQSFYSVTDEDRAFLKFLSPKVGGVTLDLPEPTLCPECRQLRRQAAVNQMHLHRNTCGLTGKPVISNFRKDSGYIVYDQKAWWGDGWDALATGRDYDFSRSFFEQYKELAKAVPYPALTTAYTFDENCEYTNYSGYNKNCYLIFDSDQNKDCYYCYSINSCIDCIDCHRARKSELTAHAIDCLQCYNCAFIQDCNNCTDSLFLKNCTSCKCCIMCSNLSNKEYHIENKPVSKEEFERVRKSLASREALTGAAAHFDAFVLQFPQKSMRGFMNENCSGDYLLQSKNAYRCFDGEALWDCRYSYQTPLPLKNSMDTEQCGDAENMYESSNCVYTANTVLFSCSCWPCRYLMYCTFCFSCNNCFGCVALKHKQYCILNKQYTQGEYEALVPKIVEHMRHDGGAAMNRSEATGSWGQFFPASLALFPYNETVAADHRDLTKEEAAELGYGWAKREDDLEGTSDDVFVPPSTITETQDDCVKKRLICGTCAHPYKITTQELALLRRKNLPLPTECFLCRHRARMAKRNPRTLWNRECGNCGKGIETTYSPERPEKVFCEECYVNAVY